MKTRSGTLLLTFALTLPAAAQLAEGDVLVCLQSPGQLVHYDASGNPVGQTTGGPIGLWNGADLMPDGGWVTSVRTPRQLALFDPTGAHTSTFGLPEVGGNEGDVGVFSDGAIAVNDYGPGKIEIYSPTGTHLSTIQVPGSFLFGLLVDQNDEVWTCSSHQNRIWHYSRSGVLLQQINTGSLEPADVDMAPDGTLWVSDWGDGRLHHLLPDGTHLGSIVTPFQSQGVGVAAAADGTLWATRWSQTTLIHLEPNGTLLGTFSLAAAPLFISVAKPDLGVRYCGPALPNSSGLPARIEAEGSAHVADNDVTLTALDLPVGEFGYFLVGSNQGMFQPPGSQGILCLTCGFQGCSGIGRFNRPGSIIQGPVGSITVDLTALPLSPPVAVVPGDVWNFQCWFRDLASSNFTDAISITFR
ncbi:MAG: hypothetical protein GY711_17915 [bacterium]|nr:hypothetical protein [bacterium]